MQCPTVVAPVSALADGRVAFLHDMVRSLGRKLLKKELAGAKITAFRGHNPNLRLMAFELLGGVAVGCFAAEFNTIKYV